MTHLLKVLLYWGINLKYDFVVGTVNVLNCHQLINKMKVQGK